MKTVLFLVVFALVIVLAIIFFISDRRKINKLKMQNICPVCEGEKNIVEASKGSGEEFEAECPACAGKGDYNSFLFQKYQQEKKGKIEPAPPNPY